MHVDVVEARDKAILAEIDRHGFRMAHQLVKALPADDPARRDLAQGEQAIRDSLLRLKAKRVLVRTADTWSRVGFDAAAAMTGAI